MKINKNSYIFSIVFTFIATFVLVLPLTLAYTATKPIADNYWRLQHYVKTLRSLGLPSSAAQAQEAKNAFESLDKYQVIPASLAAQDSQDYSVVQANVTGALAQAARAGLTGPFDLVQIKNVKVIFQALQDSSATGNLPTFFYITNLNGQKRYAGNFTGPGLWGNVTLAVGVNQDSSQIEGVQVLYNVETPGLGGRINEKGFQAQFANLTPIDGQVEFNPNGQKKPDGFDAITGATITSTAVKDIINNRALPELKAFIAQMGGM
ncbi:MAG: FMN-binding protein [Spirochaetales bacterium]|nr:FMN-binding protein [Spirochaetales bacterium]